MSKNSKKKRAKANTFNQLSPIRYIKENARKLPIYKCLITEAWQEKGVMSILVIRRHNSGNYTFASFLVDITCLGVKDVFFNFNFSDAEFSEFTSQYKDMIEVDYVLVHNIIYEAIAYAEDYGFHPHNNFAIAQYILEEDDDGIEIIDIKMGGEEGKPFLVEYDAFKFERARKILDRTAGQGNYDFIIGYE